MTKCYHWVGTNLMWIVFAIAYLTSELKLVPLGIFVCLCMHKMSHVCYERNNVNPLEYPIWSVVGDHKMFLECWMCKHKMFPDFIYDRRDS